MLSSSGVSATGAVEAAGRVGAGVSGMLWVEIGEGGEVLVVVGGALLLPRMLIEGIFLLIAEVIFWMGLGSLAGGGVGGLGLCCFPAAFAERPAHLFFVGGFDSVSGLSSSREMVLGEVVGSQGHVRFRGWADWECVLGPMVMPNAGRRLVREAMLDHCAAARPLLTSLTLKGGAGAGGCDVDGCMERVSSGLTIGMTVR